MWTYLQTGLLIGPDDKRYVAYSGKGEHKNDPESQHLENWGPIPCGAYDIGAPFDSVKHGDFCLPLTPHKHNEMFGRAGFLMHGDSRSAPGTASEGCVIAGPATRKLVYESGDKILVVQSGIVTVDPGMEAE